MRTRDLKPAFFRDLELTQLPPITRILYQGMWCRADRRGRQDGIVALIKSDIFPLEKVDIEKHLKLLADGGFIVLYEVDGKRLIWIPTFEKHQHPHPKEPESTLPPYPGISGKGNGQATAEPRSDHGDSGKSNGSAVYSQPHTLSSNTLTTNTLTTEPSGVLTRKMPFTQAQIVQLLAKFPGTNVNDRWIKFVEWVSEEEEKRRPKDVYLAFEGWLKKRSETKVPSAP